MVIKKVKKPTGSKIYCIKLFKSNEMDEIIRRVLELESNKQAYIKRALLKYIVEGEADDTD